MRWCIVITLSYGLEGLFLNGVPVIKPHELQFNEVVKVLAHLAFVVEVKAVIELSKFEYNLNNLGFVLT